MFTRSLLGAIVVRLHRASSGMRADELAGALFPSYFAANSLRNPSPSSGLYTFPHARSAPDQGRFQPASINRCLIYFGNKSSLMLMNAVRKFCGC